MQRRDTAIVHRDRIFFVNMSVLQENLKARKILKIACLEIYWHYGVSFWKKIVTL